MRYLIVDVWLNAWTVFVVLHTLRSNIPRLFVVRSGGLPKGAWFMRCGSTHGLPLLVQTLFFDSDLQQLLVVRGGGWSMWFSFDDCCPNPWTVFVVWCNCEPNLQQVLVVRRGGWHMGVLK